MSVCPLWHESCTKIMKIVLDNAESICYIETMENKTLTTATIESITRAVQTELLKRGFTARLSAERKETRHGKEFIEITSEPFNTVPVIMSEIKINGTLYVGEPETNIEMIPVSGRIGVEYSHFGGGSNGTELFWWGCNVSKESGEIYGIRAS